MIAMVYISQSIQNDQKPRPDSLFKNEWICATAIYLKLKQKVKRSDTSMISSRRI
jgi:hypothetical protein